MLAKEDPYKDANAAESSYPNSFDADSIVELLKQFERVCDECLRRQSSAGAKRRSHVETATRELTTIWKQITGKRVSLSLDTAIGQSTKDFTYPGTRFVALVLQGIDPSLTNAAVATALRRVLGKKRSGKTGKRPILNSPQK